VSFVDHTCPSGWRVAREDPGWGHPGWWYLWRGGEAWTTPGGDYPQFASEEEARRAAGEAWAYEVLRGRFTWARTGSGGPMLMSRYATFFPATGTGVEAEIHVGRSTGFLAEDTLEGFVRFAALVLATEGP